MLPVNRWCALTSLALVCLPGATAAEPAKPDIPKVQASQLLDNPGSVDFLAFLDNTQLLASCDSFWSGAKVRTGDHRLWDLAKKQSVWQVSRQTTSLTYTGNDPWPKPVLVNGQLIVLGRGGHILILDVLTGKELRSIEYTDSKAIALIKANLKDPALRKDEAHLKDRFANRTYVLEARPDGKTVIIRDTEDAWPVDLTADKIDLAKTQMVKPPRSGLPTAYAPGGQLAVVQAYDMVRLQGGPPTMVLSNQFRLADLDKDRVIERVPQSATLNWGGGAFSADGRLLAVALAVKVPPNPFLGCSNAVMATAKYKAYEGQCFRLQRDYQQMLKIMVCDGRTGKELARFGKVGVSLLAFSPDGRYLAASGREQEFEIATEKKPANPVIQIWEVATQKQIAELTGHKNAVTSLTFSPTGFALPSGSQDKTVPLLASGSADQTVRIWDLSGVVTRADPKAVEVQAAATPPPQDSAPEDAAAEKAAAGKLEIARLYAQTDKAKAIQKLEELIVKYPNTKAGEQAKKLLADWQK